jgi:AcrR family transcriptional regulator
VEDKVMRRDRDRRLATRERRAREKQRRRQSIVDAARSIFSQNGFASTTMDDIAAEAEVSKGTLYLYFDSKEELLANLLLEGLDMLLIALEDEGQSQATMTASQQIRNLAQIYANLSETHPNYLRLMMAFDCGHLSETIPPELNETVMERSSQCLKILERTVQLGIERREFAVEDAWEVAGILWAAFTGVIMMMAHPVSPQVLAIGKEKMFTDTIDLLLRALKQGAIEA